MRKKDVNKFIWKMEGRILKGKFKGIAFIEIRILKTTFKSMQEDYGMDQMALK